MIALQVIFWFCVLAVFHSYVLYPLLLRILSSKKRAEAKYSNQTQPFVSILMSAYNEEDIIEQKVQSVFNTHYPADRIEFWIGSDCSSDNTNSILQIMASKDPRIHFRTFSTRQGKAMIINQLADYANGDILILTDANVLFTPETIPELIKPMTDNKIGLVDSNMVNTNLKKEGISMQEKSYISREVAIKNMESNLWGTMMGPFGGCYGLRKELFVPVPSNLLVDDFFICMHVLRQKYKAVNNIEAVVYEDVSNDLGIEFRRKIRIATGDFQNLRIFAGLLFSGTKGLAFSFLSHKVLRWLGPFFLIIALTCLTVLAFFNTFYLVLACLYAFSFIIPLIDLFFKQNGIHNTYLRFITHFYAMNLALFIGFF